MTKKAVKAVKQLKIAARRGDTSAAKQLDHLRDSPDEETATAAKQAMRDLGNRKA